jgi:hypothetical protein
MSPEGVLGVAEHPVTNREGLHPLTDVGHGAGEFSAPDVPLGRRSPVNARTKKGCAARRPQSVRFTAVTATRTRTWSPAIRGRGTWAIRTTSGGP